MEVDVSRLRRDIESNGQFGATDTGAGRGRTVFTGSEAEKEARNYFIGQLEAAGLDITIDAVGNIVGRWTPDSVNSNAAPVATGSHLDSVPAGGISDGPLGVYAALEAIRTMQTAKVQPARPIDVVCFTEEEGQRFDTPLLGSKVAAGSCSVVEALSLTDDRGETLDEALSSIGYRGTGRIDAAKWDAWLELHIEQGTQLAELEAAVGVVTSITGIAHCNIEITGEANHAGTTPMGQRRDALAGASEFILAIEEAANEVVETRSETAVATVGTASVQPNGTNVIPGHVELSMDVRDVDASSMDYLIRRAHKFLARIERERDIDTCLEHYFDVDPTPMSDRCRDVVHTAGAETDIDTVDIHSGAGHDTMEIARVTDAGLLFAPSRDGISHNPREWTDWADCGRATQILAAALKQLAAS